MMLLAFILTMPGNNSWNGKWTGEDDLYVIVKHVGQGTEIRDLVQQQHFSYNFGDGWRASIEVKEISRAEAIKLRKKSVGFCGYDWMVASLLADGCIKT